MYSNKTVSGGRPAIDVIVMFKMFVLRQWHGLSDPELEKQCIDRISFRKFFGFSEYISDSSTVWLFRERIIEKGMIQDATFIHSDPEHAKADKPRGDEAKTRRKKAGTWTKKGGKSHFVYKLHSIIDRDYELIRRFKVTTASVYDSQVDLSEVNEVVHRDRGYFGAKSKGYDATMKSKDAVCSFFYNLHQLNP